VQARPLHNDRPKSWNIFPLSVSAMDNLHLSFAVTHTAKNVKKKMPVLSSILSFLKFDNLGFYP
jgi:hypothetical protein